MEIISFYGTDGSGKTTIAKEFAALNSDNDYVIIGGSSYKSWLTPEVAKNTLGSEHRLTEVNNTPNEMIRLYEDIAIACYGLARMIAEKGTGVVIDSDPYLKRIIWETLQQTEAQGKEYVDRFEERMTQYLGETEAPKYIVGVNMQTSATTHQQLLDRLSARETNSEHDPAAVQEVRVLDNQVRKIWREVELAAESSTSSFDGFNNRFNTSRIIHLENPDCPPNEVSTQMCTIALQLNETISDNVSAV